MRCPHPQVLAAWDLSPMALEPLPGGLINLSFSAKKRCGEQVVLQRLNPIFDPAIHHNIQAVSAKLLQSGLHSPRLLPSQSGALWERIEGEVWRVQSFVEGEVYERLQSVEQAEEAGALLGRFHRALSQLEHEFLGTRLGVHDTPTHKRRLDKALGRYRRHPAHARVQELAAALNDKLDALPPPPELPPVVIHGDPKAANIVFLGPRAHALIDLDTLARGQLADELGDALRSWCNPGGEDEAAPVFDLERFAAAIRGYGGEAAALLPDQAPAFLVNACAHISLELGLRFAADALNESYFGYDPARFPSRSAHNLHRAGGQLKLAESLLSMRAEAEAAAAEALSL